MGSDRLRRSHDTSRRYARVVHQQGRPWVEADPNEEQEIATEEVRAHALDIVGPVGTPDDGYALSFQGVSPPDFSVGPGTMYVGGVRVELTSAVSYGNQPDWLDGPVPPLHDIDVDEKGGAELVLLVLQEQEVSAVEDTELREGALGGPDTAQRTRILQRFERFAARRADTCEAAVTSAERSFAAIRGYRFDRRTMRLESAARLLVDYGLGANDKPCEPSVEQGYLGSENQLIRVQVSSAPGAPGTLLWAFDDASSLYRVTSFTTSEANGGTTTFVLASPPVDAHHAPRAGFRIEVLRSTAWLESPDDYIAAATGEVFTLTALYDAEAESVTVAGIFDGQGISTSDTGQQAPPPLFVRVWRDEIAFSPGVPVSLGATGVRVTLTALPSDVAFFDDLGGLVLEGEARPGLSRGESRAIPTKGKLGGVFAKGDYWLLGVRPGAPLTVLPERYLESPQPPDGPRIWVCPLGVLGFTPKGFTVLRDCRAPFDDLVELTRHSCTTVVEPGDVRGGAGLQTLFNENDPSSPRTIELRPGTYELTRPLVLGPAHSGLTVRACSHGVVLKAAPGREEGFLRGLVEMTYANDVTFEGIAFDVPLGPVLVNEVFTEPGLPFSVGIRPMFCQRLAILACTFTLSAGHRALSGVAVAIMAGGVMDGLVVEGNTIRGAPGVASWGLALVPAVRLLAATDPAGQTGFVRGSVVRSVIAAGSIRDNHFSKLQSPILIVGYAGALRIDRNRIADCSQGVTVVSIASLTMDTKTLLMRLGTALTGVKGDAEAMNVTRFLRSTIQAQVILLGQVPASSSVSASDVDSSPSFDTPTPDAGVATILVLAAMDASAEVPPLAVPLALHVTHNRISGGMSTPLAGVVVLDLRLDPTSPLADGIAVVSRNEIRMIGGYAGALIVMVERVTATGGVYAVQPSPESPDYHPFSLVIVRGLAVPPQPNAPSYGRVAVTGNVLEGPLVVPLRFPPLESKLPWRHANHDEG